MSRQRQSNGPDDKGRMRLVLVEVDGNNASLQDALKTFATAFGKSAVTRTVVAPTPQKELGWSTGERVAADQANVPDNLEAQFDEGETEQFEAEERVAASRRQNAMKRDFNAGLSIAKDLDLHPSGKPSFTEFFTEKAPSSQQAQVAVIMYYLTDILEVSPVTADHVFTCFSKSSARTPKDLRKVIRNTASSKGWVDSSDQNNLKTTTSGRNFIEHDLGKMDSAEE